MYAVWNGFMWHDILTRFHEECYRRSRNVKVLLQKSEKLQSCYYWWEGFMKCGARQGSGGMIYVPSSMKIGSGI
jgi:hypothetical protein